jgi:hypothetical protein
MRRFPAGAAQHQGEALPRIAIIDEITGTIGRRPSSARLYHRKSRFGEPERRKLDRNLIARMLFLAEALERRTRGRGQHGGLLKAKGLDVLRALLRSFYSYRTGECFPSHEAIARAAGCCVETVRKKLRALEAAGIIETIPAQGRRQLRQPGSPHPVRLRGADQHQLETSKNLAVLAGL